MTKAQTFLPSPCPSALSVGNSAQQRAVWRVLRQVCICLVVFAPVTLLTGCDYFGKAIIAGLGPLAGVKTTPDFVPFPDNSFDGNSTTVGNSSTDTSATSAGAPGTVLVRQADCSVAAVTFSNYKLNTGSYSGTFSGAFTATYTLNYSNSLHALSGIISKGGTYAGGCADKTTGVGGLPSVLLGHTAAGKYVGAAIDLNNNLYIGAIDPAGSFSAARLPITGIFLLYVGDPNAEGVRQLIASGGNAVAGGGLSSTLYTVNVHADGSYDSPVSIAVPASSSLTITVDDFNGDGKIDIGMSPIGVTGNMVFTVLPGKGDGTYGAAVTSVTPKGTLSQVSLTGDFNGDGKRDVIAGSNLLLGNGDGTFTLATSVPPSGATAVGDLNGDGKDDLAVVTSSRGGSVISIYLGKGDGTFTASGPSYASIYGGSSVSITDIDGDGHLDLVVGQSHSGIYAPPQYGQGMTMFLLGNGDGTFRGAYAYSNSVGSGSDGAFASGDFNGDGNNDVLTLDKDSLGNTHGFKLLSGNGKGLLTAQPTNTTVIPTSLLAADLNGDGKLDSVVTTSTTDGSGNIALALSVLKGNGDGTFGAAASFPVATAAQFDSNILALGDIRGTGKLDAVVNGSGGLYYLKGNGDGTFAAVTQIDTQTDFGSLVLADVNGDGKADIVAAAGTLSFGTLTSGKILVYLSHGDGTFASPVSITSFTNGGGMIVSDLNKDTKQDIVFLTSDSSTGAETLNVLLGRGDGTFGSPVTSSLGGQNLATMAAADVNGDGNPDLLIGACCGYTLASIAYGNGDGTFTANAGLSIGPSTNAVGFADLNNDGRPDLLLATNQTFVTSLNTFSKISTLVATSTALTLSPTAPTAGQSVKFTVSVAPITGSGTPTGTVTFLDGATALGTGTLASGTASYTGSLAAGARSITASYGGDSSYAGSVSTANNFTIATAPTLAATTTQLTASPTSGVSGATISFKAAVNETSVTATPTGTVTLSEGATTIGSASLASGSAIFSTASLGVGMHNITAAYGGDATNAASSSSSVAITITAPVAGFNVAFNPSSGSVSQGSSVTSTITVTPSGGFSGAVSFACNGLPANTTCTFSPTSITPNGTSSATSVLTIATNVKTAFVDAKPLRTSRETTSLAMLAGGGALGLLLLRRRRVSGLLLSGAIAFLLGSVVIGCGHSSSATTTPLGTTPITVTATAGATVHSAIYTLTVQ